MRLTPGLVLLAFVSGCACDSSRACKVTSDCGAGFICSRNVCQASSGSGGGTGADDAGADAGAGTGGGTGGGGFDAGQVASLVRIEVSPSSSVLQSFNGAQPTQAFVVTAFFDNGASTVVADADFTGDLPAVGTVNPVGGLFTASGLVGGLVSVTVSYTSGAQTRTERAVVEVTLERNLAPTGAPGDLATRFMGTPVTDPSRTADVVYPLDGVVFPQNVAAPDVQWLNGTAGDWLRVRITKPHLSLTSYVLEDGNHHVVLDAAAWRALAQTDPFATATLEVTRFETATQTLISGSPRSMRFAAAALVGSIYYWDIARDRIVRIDDGTTTRTEIMPTPPAGVDGASCVGCHSVSPSGRYMVGRFGGGDNIGGVFDLTTDLTGTPAPTIWPISNVVPETPRWWFSTFNPDETRIAVSRNEGGANEMGFLDPRNGQIIPVANLPAHRVTHPAWSPDGTRIAYTALSAGGWGGDATTGDIAIVPVTAPDTLGTATIVHQGASLASDTPGGVADSYPTWTPDSKWLSFSHGTSNRSEGPQSAAALYLMKPDGTEVRRLTKASGGAAATDSIQPRFSPFKAGGYFWMSFLTRRDYGNAQVGTRGTSRQQIWVSAIAENPSPTADPSEVGYWLPGQSTQSQNIAAYWAPRACRQSGNSCTVGSECCSGDCSLSMGALKCSPPPPERCRRQNETCGGTGDCCPGLGLICSQNVCILDIQ
jgi:hypothetical protein